MFTQSFLVCALTAFVLGNLPAANGKVVVLTNASAASINAAITNASDGDTIQVTATGTVTWADTVQIPDTKGISLIGPGNNTPKSSASFPLVIISNHKPAISITCDNNRSLCRISGFKFQNPNLSSDFSGYWFNSFISVRGRGTGLSGLGAYRIDNNYFDHVGNDTTIGLDGSTGELTGLVDNNTFLDGGANTVVYVIRVRETWKGASATCYGHDAWERMFAFGSAHFHFIEDNLFSRPTTEGRHDVSCDGAGGKFVVRHNTFERSYNSSYQMDYIDAHGEGSPGLGTGTRGGEIYANTFNGSGNAVGRDINLRGGQWLVYDNTFPTYAYFAMTEYRASTSDCGELESPSICDTGVPQCAGPGDFATWYPLPGQIRGTYFWNNIYKAANVTPDVAGENYVGTYIQINRDYWVSASKPSQLAAYTPFTYPHPLATAGGAVSTNPPVITGDLNARGTQGQAFSYQITAENGPTWYGAAGLPAGLVLATNSGAITGMPQTNGTFAASISAGNAFGTSSAQLTITISPLGVAIGVSPGSLDFGEIGTGSVVDLQVWVTNSGAGTLVGAASATAPFAVVSGGSYALTNGAVWPVTVRYAPTSPGSQSGSVSFTGGAGAGVAVAGQAYPVFSGWTFSATNGLLAAPFTSSGGYVTQDVETDGDPTTSGSGRAVYGFTIVNAGSYVVSAEVNAPDGSANSIYWNIDGEPTDPTMIWDIPLTTGMEWRDAAWRGNGGAVDEFSPKVFTLEAGMHKLIIRGREPNTQVQTIKIAPLLEPPSNIRVRAL